MADEQNKREEIVYLKGHLRDANQASRCQHLITRPMLPVVYVEVPVEESRIQTLEAAAGGTQAMKKVPVVNGKPKLVFHCVSPEFYYKAIESVPPDLVQQLQPCVMETTLDFCRLCPFWTVQDNGKKKK